MPWHLGLQNGINGYFRKLKENLEKVGFKGHVKNYSSKPVWVLETESGRPIAHLLKPLSKSPPKGDADAFRRYDGQPIEGHSSWWKIYDGSNAELFDAQKGSLRVSAIARTAVDDGEFAQGRKIIYDEAIWGEPIRLVTDIRRDKKKRIVSYCVSGIGWLDLEEMLVMTCRHEVDNARPVFPENRVPFVRTRRDQELINNLKAMGLV